MTHRIDVVVTQTHTGWAFEILNPGAPGQGHAATLRQVTADARALARQQLQHPAPLMRIHTQSLLPLDMEH